MHEEQISCRRAKGKGGGRGFTHVPCGHYSSWPKKWSSWVGKKRVWRCRASISVPPACEAGALPVELHPLSMLLAETQFCSIVFTTFCEPRLPAYCCARCVLPVAQRWFHGRNKHM